MVVVAGVECSVSVGGLRGGSLGGGGRWGGVVEARDNLGGDTFGTTGDLQRIKLIIQLRPPLQNDLFPVTFPAPLFTHRINFYYYYCACAIGENWQLICAACTVRLACLQLD